MNLAYTMAPGRGDTDQLLFSLAKELTRIGYRVCGTVQVNTDCGVHPCDMDVQIIPDGPILRISQNLGSHAKGCRLDASALETAVGLVATRLDQGTDVLIINKFGKHEAEGRGFRTLIGEALSSGVPVIVGLNKLNAEAFQTFAGGCAVEVRPDQPAILDWLQSVGDPLAASCVVNS